MQASRIEVFPGRLYIEREKIPEGIIKNPLYKKRYENRRRNKGKVLKAHKDSIFKENDDVFFRARNGLIIGDNAVIMEKDVILKNMELIGDRILVEPIEPEKVTEGGLIVPDTVELRPQMGYARAIGEGVRSGKVKEGDKLLFSKDAGINFEHEGKRMIIVQFEKEVIAILSNKNKTNND
jgi:chaperonin GroES